MPRDMGWAVASVSATAEPGRCGPSTAAAPEIAATSTMTTGRIAFRTESSVAAFQSRMSTPANWLPRQLTESIQTRLILSVTKCTYIYRVVMLICAYQYRYIRSRPPRLAPHARDAFAKGASSHLHRAGQAAINLPQPHRRAGSGVTQVTDALTNARHGVPIEPSGFGTDHDGRDGR